MPVLGLHPEANATIELIARADGTAILRITHDTSEGGSQRIVVLDVTTAAQLSVGIWEAAGVAQQLNGRLGGDRPPPHRPPRQPTGSGQPASSLATTSSPRRTASGRQPRGGGEEPASVNGGAAVDAEDARTIGWRLRRIRDARDKSLRVIARLAGMSSSTLHRIEHGQRAVTLSEIRALADALEIAPSELTKLPVPAPANGHTDSTTEGVRLALDGADADQPDGLVLPVAVLREQVAGIHAQRRACQFADVATGLPGLIRTVHTTLITGADHPSCSTWPSTCTCTSLACGWPTCPRPPTWSAGPCSWHNAWPESAMTSPPWPCPRSAWSMLY